jgi:hypothetical protein
MKSKIYCVSDEIKAEPAIMEGPTRETRREPVVGNLKVIEDPEIKEMLLLIKIIHFKMDKMILNLEEMSKSMRKDEN